MTPAKGFFRISFLILCSAYFLTAPQVTRAQDQGSIQGKALDASDAAVANAQITLKCDCKECGTPCTSCCPLKADVTVTTSDDGSFQFSNIPAGAYMIKASASGFAETTVSGIKVRPSATQTVEVRFQPGNISDAVSLTSSQPEQSVLKVKVINELTRAVVSKATVEISRRACNCKTECPTDPCDTCCPYETFKTIVTDGQGESLIQLSQGDYRIRVAAGAFTKDTELQIKPSAQQKVKIGLDLPQ